MFLGRLASREVGARQRRGLLEPAREVVDVERVDEHSGLGRDELGRSSDPRCDHRAAARHRLEQRLAERLDQARLREHPALGEQARHLVVRDATEQTNTLPSLEPGAERPVAGEGERSLLEARKGIGEPDDVLALLERADAEEAGGPGGGSASAKRSRSTPLDTTSTLPRASGSFVSSSRRR